MKDQTLALKWVQQNIASFGGDPKRVTIIRHSAGGGSTHMHMLSKHSEGLFQAVVSLSGLATIPAAIQRDPLSLARTTAEKCNIPNAHNISSMELLQGFQSLDIETIFAAVEQIGNGVIYTPVVENFNSSNAFFTQHPSNILTKGDYRPTRFMTGILPDDGAVMSIPIWEFENMRNLFNSDFDNFLESSLLLPTHFNRSHLNGAMERIIGEYFNGRHELSKKGILNVCNDQMFIHPFYDLARTFVHTVDTNVHPLHLYVFNYTGPYTYASVFSGNMSNLDYGVVHSDELMYLFRMPAIFPDFSKNSTDAKLSQTLVRHFVNFAANRNSSPDHNIPASGCPPHIAVAISLMSYQDLFSLA
ncbi:juvenile hormone esterase isoform X1 [Stomoxys calcitrans]|uniref:juvenile hormone esterase isoform X1 n=1 Tax=Stomoxys calcitrans TaxID=35570 RepID=UPI0027E27AF3|nr:juvenile hormone esterase isoform X1 [Stomoxys calcitrans]